MNKEKSEKEAYHTQTCAEKSEVRAPDRGTPLYRQCADEYAFSVGLRKKKFVKLPNRISPLANWTFYCGKGLASSRSIRYNVIDGGLFSIMEVHMEKDKKVTSFILPTVKR